MFRSWQNHLNFQQQKMPDNSKKEEKQLKSILSNSSKNIHRGCHNAASYETLDMLKHQETMAGKCKTSFGEDDFYKNYFT
uniref:Uncharacterized protein n=1 Tax=Globodera rostochiensis TaxID=31243 RepID=A0A914IDJ5_GLORO